MCSCGGQCARGVGNVRSGWEMGAWGGKWARGVENVRAGWEMYAQGGKCARGVGDVFFLFMHFYPGTMTTYAESNNSDRQRGLYFMSIVLH